MNNIKLCGHSGCKLEVVRYDGVLSVIKVSKDSDYDKRLKAQEEKQKNFCNSIFKAPRILGDFKDENGRFCFIMEYVNGVTLSEYLKKISISDIEKFANMFLSFIPNDFIFDPEAKSIFLSKITDLESKINVESEVFFNIFSRLKKNKWDHCVSSSCHGDLTLENMIWDGNNIYLIDFLDSFYDSWMVDLAKLLQDLECFWSYRNDKNIDENLKIRLFIFKKIILDKICALPDGKQILQTLYDILLIHLLRIIPYTKDDFTKNYLNIEINRIFEKVNKI